MQTHSTVPRPLLGVGPAGFAFGIAAALAGLLRLHDAAPSLSWGWLALSTSTIELCGTAAGCLLFCGALPRLGLFYARADRGGAGGYRGRGFPPGGDSRSLTSRKNEVTLRFCETICLGSVLLALTVWLVTRGTNAGGPRRLLGMAGVRAAPRNRMELLLVDVLARAGDL